MTVVGAKNAFEGFDPKRVPSPCFVVDEVALEQNMAVLADIASQSGAKILQALKAFSLFELAHLSSRYLDGVCASGVHEAQLAKDFYQGEVHVLAAAYSEADFVQLLELADCIVFNSGSQLQRFESRCRQALLARPHLRFGLRINPEHSEGVAAVYDPCTEDSRLGVRIEELSSLLKSEKFRGAFSLVSGLHFHTLCEKDFPPLQRTLAVVEQQFGHLIDAMQWINFGGGHHLTAACYQRPELVQCIREFADRHSVQVYLEPGEAVAQNCGVLVGEVLDVFDSGLRHAILDVSATCHMPDTLEMPYRPDVLGSGIAGEKTCDYRFGGPTCLAGDSVDDYSFDRPLEVGQRLMFTDMAHYTMVKTTTFNGTQLPTIAVWNSDTDALKIVREFSYEDYKSRLS